MNETQFQRLRTLVETHGVAGFERGLQEQWRQIVEPVADQVVEDAYGNCIAVLNPNAEDGIAFASHADQIGLIVRKVDADGQIHPGRIGRVDRTTLPGRRVRIHTADGSVPGVIGQRAIHLREDEGSLPASVGECRIDVGADTAEEVPDSMRVGDPITFEGDVQRLANDRVVAPALDNRAGGWVVAEVFRRLAERDLDRTVVCINTGREEIGQLGAAVAGGAIDTAQGSVPLSELVSRLFVVDVTFATDHPQAPTDAGSDINLGGGPVVTRGGVNSRTAVETALAVGEAELDTPPQLEAIGGLPGTDTEAFVRASGGVPVCYVGLPCRYMHTPGEVIDTTDLLDTCDLLVEIARAEWQR